MEEEEKEYLEIIVRDGDREVLYFWPAAEERLIPPSLALMQAEESKESENERTRHYI